MLVRYCDYFFSFLKKYVCSVLWYLYLFLNLYLYKFAYNIFTGFSIVSFTNILSIILFSIYLTFWNDLIFYFLKFRLTLAKMVILYLTYHYYNFNHVKMFFRQPKFANFSTKTLYGWTTFRNRKLMILIFTKQIYALY